jgi:8-oxo-dGTP diphosphatase
MFVDTFAFLRAGLSRICDVEKRERRRIVRPMNKLPEKDGVVAVLKNDEGHYLFIRRGLNLKRAPGVWCFVGGEVEPDEPFDAAIVREVWEEVGLNIEPLSKVHESVSPNGEFKLHWFEVRMTEPGQAITASPTDVAEFRWLTFGEALSLDPVLPTLRDWLKRKADE